MPSSLLALLFFFGCSRELPQYQQAALAHDASDGNSPAIFRIRLWPGLVLAGARAERDQVVLTCRSSEGHDMVLAFKLLRPNSAALVRYGGAPSWCGTCTPHFVRDLPVGYRMQRQLDGVKQLATSAYDRVMDRVIQIL